MTFRAELLLSAQRAFLGRIHPEMRLIKIKADKDELAVWVILDHEATEKVREDVSEAATEIISDFPDVNKITEHFAVGDDPMRSSDDIWFYKRA